MTGQKPVTCNSQINANPSESHDPVVLLNAEHVHDDEDDGDQDVDERQSVEKLRRDEERCK